MSKFNDLVNKIFATYKKNDFCKYKNIVNENGNTYSGSKFLYKGIMKKQNDIILENFNTDFSGNIISDAIVSDYTPADNEKGGIIVFSTVVNAVKQDDNYFLDFLKKKIKTIVNHFTAEHKIDIIAKNHNLIGWTIGRFLHGRYTSPSGKFFSENSLSVEIIGISFDELVTIGEEICRSLDQETVLVKDYTSWRIVFVNGN